MQDTHSKNRVPIIMSVVYCVAIAISYVFSLDGISNLNEYTGLMVFKLTLLVFYFWREAHQLITKIKINHYINIFTSVITMELCRYIFFTRGIQVHYLMMYPILVIGFEFYKKIQLKHKFLVYMFLYLPTVVILGAYKVYDQFYFITPILMIGAILFYLFLNNRRNSKLSTYAFAPLALLSLWNSVSSESSILLQWQLEIVYIIGLMINHYNSKIKSKSILSFNDDNFLEKIFDKISDGTIILDGKSSILYSNNYAKKIFGEDLENFFPKSYGGKNHFYDTKNRLIIEEKNHPLIKTLDDGFFEKNKFYFKMSDSKSGVFFDVKGERIFDKQDQEFGLIFFIKDITENVLELERITIEHSITKFMQRIADELNKGLNLKESYSLIIKEMTIGLEWDFGHIYFIEDSKIVSSKIWYENISSIENFKKTTENLTFNLDEGFPGYVCDSNSPIWIENISKLSESKNEGQFKFERFEGNEEIKSILGIPVNIGEKIVAVIELYSCSKTFRSNVFMKTIRTIGYQIGRMIDRVIREEYMTIEKEEAIKEAKNKANFLATMSHEIRTPMNGIIGMTNILMDTVKDKEFIDKLQTIQNCGNNLLTIINDILDYSKIEAEKMTLEKVPFKLESAIIDIFDMLRIKAEEKNIQFFYNIDHSVPKFIESDVTRLSQILTNLLGNAIKFTQKGRVELFVYAKQLKNKSWDISFDVKDTGIGMNRSGVYGLFKAFTQADSSTTRRFGGTGLGLVISKALVEALDGKIQVESDEGKGSVFSFNIIANESSEKIASVPKDKNFIDPKLSKKNPLKILLAEDNRVNQVVALKLLEKFGYRADVAANGLEAINMQLEHRYDLIFMDCHMPELDGLEACKRIKSLLEENFQTRIVALTASAMQEDREECKAAGMDDFISKPINLTELSRVLRVTKDGKIQR